MPYKEFKIEKLYYTIGEVADLLGENTSLVRFWSDKFSSYIKPERNKKGNRKYSAEDVKTLKTIHYLVKERGMTLEGAQARLKNNKEGSDNRAEVVTRLTAIKQELLEIHKGLSVEDES
ncbi:MAG: MerR family transcriptional regulator [Bacteroidales bacterium]|nr:MerR family transcriptional regulator [Bacteroidales bacterium]